jgi:hypothetical protein
VILVFYRGALLACRFCIRCILCVCKHFDGTVDRYIYIYIYIYMSIHFGVFVMFTCVFFNVIYDALSIYAVTGS